MEKETRYPKRRMQRLANKSFQIAAEYTLFQKTSVYRYGYNVKKPTVCNVHIDVLKMSIIVAGIDDQWSIDLANMTKYSKDYDGIKYLLVALDLFSKYLLIRRLKDETGESVFLHLLDILRGLRRPSKLRGDMGQEFRS